MNARGRGGVAFFRPHPAFTPSPSAHRRARTVESRANRARLRAMAARSALRSLPAVDELLRVAPAARCWRATRGRWSPTRCAAALDDARQALRARRRRRLRPARRCSPPRRRALAALAAPSLRPVVNATGVVLHTNLGRAPLAAAAVEALRAVAAQPCTLELDLADGGRGERDAHVEAHLCALTGAAAALVVNNNAAGVLLALNTLAEGREVVVSRGELVEIGGAFRIPDVCAKSRRDAARGRHHQPHAPRRLRARHRRAHRACCSRCTRRTTASPASPPRSSSRRWRRSAARTACRWSRTSAAARWST